MKPVVRCLLMIMLGLSLLSLSGCSKLETEYGRSVGLGGRKSIAGFGVLRDFYRRNDWNDRTLSRLSERLNNIDTIVWTPNAETPLSNEATKWFETWLARGDKTLIYVLKDHQTEYEYWRQASRLAPPQQRLEYRRRLARAKLDRDRLLLARPAMITNGWFTALPTNPPVPVQSVGGSWSEQLSGFSAPLELEYQVRPFKRGTDTVAAGPAVPGAFGAPFDYTPTDLSVEFNVLLTNDSGIPIVSEITHPTWANSEILVVSAGSLLTNFGLTDPGSQQLAGLLLAESGRGNDGEVPKVGFLASGPMGVRVTSLNPEAAGPTGAELFTEYPLNIVTIHLFLLMSFVCLMLFPIFGRPKRIAPRPTADFAAHIDAVAGLMRRSGGAQYAKVRISEYMVRVRGETDGPWVIKQKETPPVSVANPASASASTLDEVQKTDSQKPDVQKPDTQAPTNPTTSPPDIFS